MRINRREYIVEHFIFSNDFSLRNTLKTRLFVTSWSHSLYNSSFHGFMLTILLLLWKYWWALTFIIESPVHISLRSRKAKRSFLLFPCLSQNRALAYIFWHTNLQKELHKRAKKISFLFPIEVPRPKKLESRIRFASIWKRNLKKIE